MIETQQTICTWADSTFGPASDASIAARALVEMAELVTACVNGEPAERIGEEIADVVIVLARLGRSVGVDVIRMTIVDAAYFDDEIRRDALVDVGHAMERVGRILSSLAGGGSTYIGSSTAALMRLARNVGINLPAAIDAKMSINRARRWVIDEHGHGQHVKEGQ